MRFSRFFKLWRLYRKQELRGAVAWGLAWPCNFLLTLSFNEKTVDSSRHREPSTVRKCGGVEELGSSEMREC